MNVTLSKDSWHYKIYKRVLGGNPPMSLCPYFWSIVGILIVSPILLIILGGPKLIDSFKKILPTINLKSKPKPEKTYEQMVQEYLDIQTKNRIRDARINRLVNFGTSFLIWVVVPVLAMILIWIIYDAGVKVGWLNLLLGLVYAIGGMGVCIGVIYGFIYLIERYSDSIGGTMGKFFKFINPLNWSIVQMIGGMIYATYKKACPIIDWGTDKSTTEEVNNEYGTN